MKLYERLPEATLTGRPTPLGDMLTADCIIVQELGSNPELRSNQDILEHLDGVLNVFDEHKASERLQTLPLFVSGSITKVLRQRVGVETPDAPVVYRGHTVHAFVGASATNSGENLGTYGELQQFKAHRDQARDSDLTSVLEHPLLVTSGYNAMNIDRQAKLLGITGLIIPPELPRSFDWRSEQLWTKHWALWVLTSHLRLHKLRKEGH